VRVYVARFVCSFPGCGKRYVHLQSRKEHEYSHYGEKPFKCDFPGCGMAFTSSSNRKRHVRLHSKREDGKAAKE
jgi:uncharacterized Zn-finger protein